MKKFALLLIGFLGLMMTSFIAPVSAMGPDDVEVRPVFRDSYGYGNGYEDDRYDRCRRLRYACLHKEELGEQGQGNCRRYHDYCGGESMSYCERLRRACHDERENGEGYGRCHRYHEECR